MTDHLTDAIARTVPDALAAIDAGVDAGQSERVVRVDRAYLAEALAGGADAAHLEDALAIADEYLAAGVSR